MILIASVAAGGALGAVLRYGVGLAATRFWGVGFPVGTVCVNVVGSFVMGILATYIVSRSVDNEALRLFWMTGLLGGFTTFSTFSMDTIALWQRGESMFALIYVGLSLLGALAAFMLGAKLALDWI